MRSTLTILALISLLIPSFELCAQNWEMKKNENGIAVYTAATKSGYKIFKASMKYKTTHDALIKLVKDTATAPRWMYKCSQLEILKYPSHYTWITRTSIEMPWPIDDRDIVAKLSLVKIPNGYEVKIKSIPKFIRIHDDYVRLNMAEGFWRFQNIKNGEIKITYQFLSEPEGLPSWIVNLFIVDAPFDTLKNMKKMLELQQYKSAKLHYLH